LWVIALLQMSSQNVLIAARPRIAVAAFDCLLDRGAVHCFCLGQHVILHVPIVLGG